jgi:PKD repeat protein
LLRFLHLKRLYFHPELNNIMNKLYKLLLVLLAFAPLASRAQDSCNAGFTVVNGNAPLTKIFTAQTWHSQQKPVTEICWYFGDGHDTCIAAVPGTVPPLTIQHTYGQAGTYNVCVKIRYQGGCVSERCNPVQVGSVTQTDSCRADFNVFSTAGAPLVRSFSPLPWHNNNKPVIEVKWDFGDGTPALITPTATTVNHTYAQAGTYNVCIRIKYEGGCISEKCKPVIINTNTQADSCTADFSVIVGASAGLRMFTPIPWHNNNKPVIEVRWNFGDGTPALVTVSTTAVTHIYTVPGTYNVCIRIKYEGGCVSEKCKVVIVGQQPDMCSSYFEVQQASATTLTRYFIAQPWHNNNKPPIQVCWRFGDGHDTCLNAVNGALPPLTIPHTYSQPGVYNVCVKITYDGGCVSDTCRPITVTGQATDSCRANFETSLLNTSPLARRYTALPLHSNGKKPQQICWKFGDGRDTCISYAENYTGLYNVQHQYQQPGVYTVCIRIKYFGGCIAEYCRPVTVAEASCRALFTDSMISRFKVKFKGQTIVAQPNNPVISWQWTFGDGSAGTGQNVIHEYPHPGSYNVCLKITTANGCQHTYCRVKVIDSGVRILQLHPNPVINTLYITYYSFRNEMAQIKIYNVFGILVRSFTRQMTIGYNNFSTEVGTLPPGPYSLVVQTPTTTAASVFFKQ